MSSVLAPIVWELSQLRHVQAVCGFESYFDALSTMLMNVGQSAPRYDKYALLYPASASLRQELCNYFSVVVDLCKSAILFIRKSFVSQALHALRKPFDDEFGKFGKDLEKFGGAVRDEISLAAKQQQNLDSIEAAPERKENSLFRRAGAIFQQEAVHQLEENKKWRKLRFRSSFLNSCSTYNYETALNQARRKGRSSWLFETNDYRKWKSSDSTSVFLCSGIVGAGKTVLSSSIVEELLITKRADVLVGYFFCRDDDLESLKAREIMGSLARQFLRRMSTDSFNNVDRDVEGITLNTEQILAHLLRILPRKGQYIIVLDGLDECEPGEAFHLFETLQSLFRSSTHIFKLFWTGRSDFVATVVHRIEPDFHVTISQSNNGPEISRFIEHALDEALDSGRFQLRDPQIILKIQDALEAEAHEMFLWVTFQIDSICRENTDDGILKALEDLPKDLPTTYRRILRRLRDSGSTDPLMGKKIFEIVSAAQRPLDLEELREAISIEPGNTTWNALKLVNDMKKSLGCCGSLVVIDEELSTVHFAHSSIKQHLETFPDEFDISEYHIVLRTANLVLGEIVVTYLNLDVLQPQQLTNYSKASEVLSSQDTSRLITTSLSLPAITGTTLARKLLKNRKTPQFDIGRELEKAAGLTREPKIPPLQANSLFSYAQEHWLSHGGLIYIEDPIAWSLFLRLVHGDSKTVKTTWTLEDASSLSSKFVNTVAQSGNEALMSYVSEIHRRQASRDPTVFTRFINQRRLKVDSLTLLTAVRKGDASSVQRLLDNGRTNFEDKGEILGMLLNIMLWDGNPTNFAMLLGLGADVNAEEFLHSSVVEAAAFSPFGSLVVPKLLEKGAHEIPIKESYPKWVKQLLVESYELHKRKLAERLT